MNNRNVLVTGGAGYIGSHTCKELAKNNFVPIVFDNLSTGHSDFVKWGPLFVGDLKNKKDIKDVFDQYRPKSVIHFAAKASVTESVHNPIKYFEENIYGTSNLLEQFVEQEGTVFIFSSSCSVYGDLSSDVISEKSPLNPINPYGFSKLSTETLIKYLKEKVNFNYSILRYFNAAGADPDLQIGEQHYNESHVIPILVEAYLKDFIFPIYGNDYATQDGTAIRDFIHVVDLARAHVLALNYNLLERRDILCNLGTGIGVSVLELVNEIRKINPKFDFTIKQRRAGDPAKLVADVKIAREILKFEPIQSSLSNIILSALNWHRIRS